MAKGPDDFADSWVDGKIAVSGYILSASVAYVPDSMAGVIVGVRNLRMLVRIFGGFYRRCCLVTEGVRMGVGG